MEKNVYNMLVYNSLESCSLASTGALAFSNVIAPCRGSGGNLYVEVSGFHTATGGITIQLYSCYTMDGTYIFNTALAAIDTAGSQFLPVTLGAFNKIRYDVSAEDGLDNAKIFLETNDEV